jgi:hypothetical protein
VNDVPVLQSTEGFSGTPYSLASTGNSDLPKSVIRRFQSILRVLDTKRFGKLSFPFSHWTLFKHHQWMILHRNWIYELQSSPTAMYLLAFMEFAVSRTTFSDPIMVISFVMTNEMIYNLSVFS